ncbi:MAG: aminotransferase class III-fold pyridoxal phosphate-dependent enzyme [Planctomycetes bacterium]|nr:aminotransferase class III-fold pyridoxal phosphate-dependent enzyme [Planctomycetota bacterium]
MAKKTKFKRVRLSLADLVGAEYVDAVAAARSKLTGERRADLQRITRERVDFFPAGFQKTLSGLLPKVGEPFSTPLANSASGASTRMFNAASKAAAAPLSCWGYYRIGENGRLYFISKSEHYHVPVGHAFPGYRLVEHARRLGVPNATHNNTRGHITRLLEEELVRTSNGIARDDRAALARALRSKAGSVLNRVLNLETGSLAAEAGIKMLLGRFYRLQEDSPKPKYEGRTPVIVVIGDDEGGPQANYHGTTFITQILRGMWPAMGAAFDKHGLMKVATVRPNNHEELEAVFRKYERGPFKIAGFVHEIVLMNYGGRLLSKRFVKRAYALCRKHDVPTMVDEIQSCVWSPELYMYREYGLRPTFAVVGKGIPGGEYAASRIIFSAGMDYLPQFGALVTNGQEELASLAYLVTMRWAEENSDVTAAVGEYYEAALRELIAKYPQHVSELEGRRHMASIYFHELDKAKAFVKRLVDGGLDISVQAYKANCPPGALTKLPLIAGYDAVDMVLSRMDKAFEEL